MKIELPETISENEENVIIAVDSSGVKLQTWRMDERKMESS